VSAKRRPPHPALPSQEADIARCLAFVNTLSGRPTPAPVERLVSYDALVDWGKDAGVLKPTEAERLLGRAKRRPAEREPVLARARELRELLHLVFTATSDGRNPEPATLARLSAHLAGWYEHGRLAPAAGTLQWVYAGDDDLDRVVWEVARAAARVLTSDQLARIRACAAEDCAWWFLDDTKNRSRRWCDMKLCGNREKVRRFRARTEKT
jgi:predicted RNA-binding Zn ribbon-like protein